jgi:hypothetical protein
MECFVEQEHNTFFSCSHGTFDKIDYFLSPQTHLNLKEVIQCLLSDKNASMLEIGNKKKQGNFKTFESLATQL